MLGCSCRESWFGARGGGWVGVGVGAAGEGWFRADVWRVISRCVIGFAEDRCVCVCVCGGVV